MIRITDKAKEKIIDVLSNERKTILRFGLQGGGCSGLQYYFSMEDSKEDDDIVYPLDDTMCLIVDSMSDMYLENAEIDYKKDLMGESFVFNNPNEASRCGCGHSASFE